jgi:hypothetical protein
LVFSTLAEISLTLSGISLTRIDNLSLKRSDVKLLYDKEGQDIEKSIASGQSDTGYLYFMTIFGANLIPCPLLQNLQRLGFREGNDIAIYGMGNSVCVWRPDHIIHIPSFAPVIGISFITGN